MATKSFHLDAKRTLLYICSSGRVISCLSLIIDPLSFRSRYRVEVSKALSQRSIVIGGKDGGEASDYAFTIICHLGLVLITTEF